MSTTLSEPQTLALPTDRTIADAPAFWNDRQQAARELFDGLAWPVEKDENWRYSNVERLKFDKYNYSPTPVPDKKSWKTMLKREQVSGQIVFQNDRLVSLELDRDLAEQGVIFGDLASVLAERPELIEKHFMTEAVKPDYNKFSAFHAAMVSQGAVLFVPKNVVLEKPFEVLHTIAGDNVTIFPHMLIIAEQFAEVSFINSYGNALDENTGLCVAATEMFVGDGATVNFVTMNNWGTKMRHFELQRHIGHRDSQVKNLVMTLGSGFARMNVDAVVAGENASSEMLGLYVATGNQQFDHRTFQDHQAGNAFSDVLYKGALLDSSQTIFSGMIRVAPGAQKTDAYQTNRNMCLSPTATAYTMPGLEIEANDVKCSHGATVGQIEFEHLFYLMSRGIPKMEAEKLIVFGFFDEVLNRLPVPVITETIRDRIGEKILGIDYEQIQFTRRLGSEN